ncbi:hypothetical protein D018_2951A, partial [Vibrio parahaemolyticus VP2007-007]
MLLARIATRSAGFDSTLPKT